MTSQQSRFANIMEAVGLRVLEPGAEKPLELNAVGTAIVRPTKIGYMRRFAASVFEFLAEIDPSVRFRDRQQNFEWKLDCARKRAVMDPDDPTIPFITFCKFWISTDNQNRKLLNLDVSLPDPNDLKTVMKVRATPHVLFDGAGGILPYFTTEILTQKDAEGVDQNVVRYHMKSMLCMVLRPGNARDPYRVVPFGLAAPGMIETWNQVAAEYRDRGESSQKWPEIAVMPNNLRVKQGMRVLLWKPSRLADNGDGTYNYGEIHGRLINSVNAEDLANPDQNPQTLKWGFEGKYYFLIVRMNDQEVRVKCLGKEGVADLRSGKFNLEGTGRLDGFAVLALDPITANADTVMRFALKLVELAPLDVSNPAYAYALSIGEVNPGTDSPKIMREILRPIAVTSAIMVCGELKIALEDFVVKLSGIQGLPSVEEVLAGEELETVWFRKSGDDVLGAWISSKMEANFSWKSWLLRNIRLELFRLILTRDGIAPPAKKLTVKAEEPKVEDAPVVPPTDTPAAAAAAIEEEPADATPPTTPRRRARKAPEATTPS